jgi:amino acid transporter
VTSETSSTDSSLSTLKREFKLYSTFALAFAFISPIVAIYGIFALALVAGGPSFWWAFPIVLVGQLLVALVFAELVSIWPLEGSVYQWSQKLVGRSYGWFAGWTYIWTLVIAIAAVSYGAAGFITVVLGINASHSTLILIALVVLALGTATNTIGRRVLKVVVSLSIAAELLGSIVIGTVLLLFYRENSLSVLGDGFGDGHTSGYLSGGLLAAMAFVGWSFVGFESAGAIAEEVEEPERDVPRAILLSLLLVAVVVMYAGIALLLAVPNLADVLAGKDADPVASTLATQLGSGITKPLFIVITIGFFASLVAIQAAVSRVIYAFARDEVLPAASFLRRLSREDRLPINALLVTAVFSAALLSFTGSKLNTTLVSFTTGGFYIAFAFPLLGALYVRSRGGLRRAPFSLGGWGLPLNLIAAVWVVAEIVNIGWPRSPGTPWYQNYGVVVMFAVIGLIGIAAYLPIRARETAQDGFPTAADESG